MAPGPEVARQTPTSPVNFACAQAANEASSSWRTWMNAHAVADLVEGAEDAVDAVARVAVDALDAPCRRGARE